MLITFILTTILAFVIKGLTGFGPALVMIPVFSYFMPFTEVVPISGALLFFSNLPLAFSGRGQLPKRSFLPAALGFGIGVALGGNLLVILPEEVLQRILGATLIGFCGYQLWGGRQVDERPRLNRSEQLRAFGGLEPQRSHRRGSRGGRVAAHHLSRLALSQRKL